MSHIIKKVANIELLFIGAHIRTYVTQWCCVTLLIILVKIYASSHKRICSFCGAAAMALRQTTAGRVKQMLKAMAGQEEKQGINVDDDINKYNRMHDDSKMGECSESAQRERPAPARANVRGST